MHQQATETKQLKQIVTLENNYISSQTAEFHLLLRASRDLFNSLVRLVGSLFEGMQNWRAIPLFYCSSFALKRTPDMSLF